MAPMVTECNGTHNHCITTQTDFITWHLASLGSFLIKTRLNPPPQNCWKLFFFTRSKGG